MGYRMPSSAGVKDIIDEINVITSRYTSVHIEAEQDDEEETMPVTKVFATYTDQQPQAHYGGISTLGLLLKLVFAVVMAFSMYEMFKQLSSSMNIAIAKSEGRCSDLKGENKNIV